MNKFLKWYRAKGIKSSVLELLVILVIIEVAMGVFVTDTFNSGFFMGALWSLTILWLEGQVPWSNRDRVS